MMHAAVTVMVYVCLMVVVLVRLSIIANTKRARARVLKPRHLCVPPQAHKPNPAMTITTHQQLQQSSRIPKYPTTTSPHPTASLSQQKQKQHMSDG